MMRRRRARAGFTLVELLLIVVAIGLAIAVFLLWRKVDDIDEKGRELTAWIGRTDGPAADASADGLATYLIGLSNKIHDHIKTVEPGHTKVHCPSPCGPDHHLDPPPPPNW